MSKATKISVLGCGRWGSFLSWYSDKLGHKVTINGRKESKSFKTLVKTRGNEYLKLQDSIILDSNIKKALDSEIILIAVGTQGLRSLCKHISAYNLTGKTFVLCMKGLEESTGKRLSEVFREEISQAIKLAVWVGPGHVQEFIKEVPSCMVVSSDNLKVTQRIVTLFSSNLIRFYYGQDLIGSEIGAASKNVMGIAAGMLDGLNLSSLKGALIARGPREISQLVRTMGGNELTIYGLSHTGDYAATLFSKHSHNRKFGEAFIKEQKFNKLAEGVSTTKALIILSKRHNADLPICKAVYDIIENKQDAREVINRLFLRPTKYEF